VSGGTATKWPLISITKNTLIVLWKYSGYYIVALSVFLIITFLLNCMGLEVIREGAAFQNKNA